MSSPPPPTSSLPSSSHSAIDTIARTQNKELSKRKSNNFHQDDDRKSSSPYYNGLTDSSLVLNIINNSPHSTNIRPVTSTNSSFNSIIIDKMIELSSCFSFKSNKKRHDHAFPSSPLAAPPHHPASFSSLLLSPSSADTLKANVTLVEEITTSTKPLRGRVCLEHERAGKSRTLASNEAVLNENKNSDHESNKVSGDKVVGYTWAEKYRPRSLSDFICNRDKAEYLKTLMKTADCGHFIFKGPPGVGKRTMIWGMLGEAFGADRQGKATQTSSQGRGPIRVNNVKTSLEPVEVGVGDNLGYEKLVELIKEAQTKLSKKALKNTIDNCIAIIIYEAEKMSEDALLYIRWLLERYKGYNKVFFCCSDDSKLQPIKSICTTVELLPPSKAEIVEVLKFIADKESIELPIELAERVADNSNNNLRQAIRSFEATSRFCYPLKKDQMILTGWEEDISNMAKNIAKEQSSKQLYIVRGELQNLTDHNVSPEFICQILVKELKEHLEEGHHYIVDDLYDEYNNGEKSSSALAYNHAENMDMELVGPSNINCLCFSRMEEFIAKFMSTYKSLLVSKKTGKDEKAS